MIVATDGKPASLREVGTTAEGIEKYRASGAIRSIGPKIAARIVAVHHERTLEVLEKTPDFLLHVKFCGPRLGRFPR